MEWTLLLALAATGLAAGFLSALLGIGGGVLMVPVLHYGFGYAWHTATALSLAAIVALSPAGVYQHARRHSVSWRVGLLMATGGLAGVAAGVWLERRLDVPWIKILFALVMAFAAYRLVRSAPAARTDRAPPAVLVALGVAGGVAAKLFGIGSGLVTVPVMALLGIPIHLAVGSSLVPVFTNAVAATLYNLAGGLAWPAALALVAGALAGVPLGARTAHALDDRWLRRVFAAALALAAVAVAATSGVW